MQLLVQKESELTKYYKLLLKQDENQKILIHDIKKHLHSIALLNQEQESQKISQYIEELLNSSSLKDSVRFCDNEFLNAILAQYHQACIEQNTQFQVDIRNGCLSDISSGDLTALFCNLLDNAISSTKNIRNSFIELSVRQKENLSVVVIVLINSCRCSPDYDKDGLPISSKVQKGMHGYGMKSIQKVVKSHRGNIQTYYQIETATFHTIITLRV